MPIDSLSGALTVLSAMLTPAVLIMATSSLSMTTSQRLSRSIDRARKVSEQLSKLNDLDDTHEFKAIDKEFFTQQLLFATRRSRLMQRAMTCLYVALSIFVAIIIVIGLFEVMGLSFAWVLLLLGFSGVMLLLCSCTFLILESRLALHAVNKEMDHTVTRYILP